MRSSSDADARPVRTVLNSARECSTDFPIRSCASWISSSTVAMLRALLVRLDDRSDVLTGDDARDVAVGELEHVNRELVVHAEGERGRVHDAQPALDRLEMRQMRKEGGPRVDARIAVVDPGDTVLRHEDRVGSDLERAQRGGRVGGEERVARARREDDDAALLQVPNRPAPYVR